MRPGSTSTAAIAAIVNHMIGHAHSAELLGVELGGEGEQQTSPRRRPSTCSMKK